MGLGVYPGLSSTSKPKYMKYFAKYLPVEGAIKEHDLVFKDSQLGTVVHIYPDGEAFEVELFKDHVSQGVETCPAKRVRLARLFLCSRDIQVGDKTNLGIVEFASQDLHTPVFEYQVNGKSYWGTLHPEIYKVIGEISSQATWVKEGDEFTADGDDCEVFPLHVHDQLTEEMIYIDEDDNVIYTPIYLIKGPCGHFH